MDFKISLKFTFITFCYILNLIHFATSNDSDDAEKYNVGGVLSDFESEKHFRLTISVSIFFKCIHFL